MEVNLKNKTERSKNMSIYSYLLDRVSQGAKFNINLVEKILKIDGKEIVLEGNLIDEDNMKFLCISDLSPWEQVEYLYKKYKRSVPSTHNNGNKPYFKADSIDDLTDDEIAFNGVRNWCQAVLEGFMLLAGLSGWLKFENENHWFWQSKVFPELVVLKEWI
jgi:hypothetical protein